MIEWQYLYDALLQEDSWHTNWRDRHFEVEVYSLGSPRQWRARLVERGTRLPGHMTDVPPTFRYELAANHEAALTIADHLRRDFLEILMEQTL